MESLNPSLLEKATHPLMVLYQDLNHNILKLDVHDGCYRLLLWAEQRWPENHTQVSDSHEVLLVVTGHAVETFGQKEISSAAGSRVLSQCCPTKQFY